MTRIFFSVALVDFVALLATFVVGLVFKLMGTTSEPLWMAHLYLALFSAIATLLVHCLLIFTYFLGTGRWVKEVGIAYQLPDVPLLKLTRDLKRRTYPLSLFAMLITIAAVAAGAGAQNQLPAWPWHVHLTLACLALLINGWAFVVAYRNIRINGSILEEVMREVERIRAERGLPSNEEALQR